MDNRTSIVIIFFVARSVWQAHAAIATCTIAGRFADTSDTSCQNYTLCVYNPATGSFLAYYYHCPTTSVFNPNTQKCTASTNYICKNTASNEPTCIDEGFFPDETSIDCTSFIACVALGNDYVQSKYTCATGSYFDPSLEDCFSNYVCPSACTAAGRFAVTADTTCTTFYSCVDNQGVFVQTLYTCPSPSVFNPTTKQCSTKLLSFYLQKIIM